MHLLLSRFVSFYIQSTALFENMYSFGKDLFWNNFSKIGIPSIIKFIFSQYLFQSRSVKIHNQYYEDWYFVRFLDSYRFLAKILLGFYVRQLLLFKLAFSFMKTQNLHCLAWHFYLLLSLYVLFCNTLFLVYISKLG